MAGSGTHGFVYGDLAALYPSYTYEQLTEIREANFAIFQTLVTRSITNNEQINIAPGRLEFYYGTGTQINVNDGQRVTLLNRANIIIYPFVRTADSTLFNLNTGAEINILGDGTFGHVAFPAKVEAYNVTLAYGGNKSLVKLNTVPRTGFLDSIVGQVIYVSPGFELPHVARTVVSYLGDEITLSAPLTVDDDFTNYFTNISYKFDETISLADYETYGGFWWNGYAYDHYFIYSLPLVSETNPVLITIKNSLSDFTEIIAVAAEKFGIEFQGNVELANATRALSAFSQSAYNLQRIDFNELTFNNCGILILGGFGSVVQPITANNILGSGAYIHPNVIVDGGILTLTDCTAASWRWYGFDGATTQGYENNIIQVIATGNNEEYVLRTSKTEETIIPYVEGPGLFFFNRGDYAFVDVTSIVLFSEADEAVVINFGEVSIRSFRQLKGFENQVNIDSLSVKSLNALDYNSPNVILNAEVFISSFDVLDYGSYGNYTPGVAEAGDVFNGIIYPLGSHNIVIENIEIESKCGILLNYGGPRNLDYNSQIVFKNGSVLCSRIFSVTGFRGFFRNMLVFENVVLGSIAGGQGNESRFASLVFRIKPVIANVEKTPSAGILEFEFQNELTINGGGTIRILRPYLYNSQGTKVLATRYFVGDVTLHAVGGDIVLEGYDVYADSNIAVSETIPAGASKVLTCSPDNVRGVLTLGSSKVEATTGAVQYTIDLGIYSAVYPESVVTSFGTVILNGAEEINDVNVTGFWDKVNGTIRLNFNSAPTGNITLNYGTYSSVTASGTWS